MFFLVQRLVISITQNAPLKNTQQDGMITLVISQKITLPPIEAGQYLTQLFKQSDKGIAAISVGGDNEELNNQIQKTKIWDSFTMTRDKILCNICKQVFSLRSSTSTLRRHLEIKHSKQNHQQQTLEQAFRQQIFSQQKAESLLIQWVIDSLQSLREVEKSSFKQFITYLKPEFKLMKKLKKLDCKVSISIDMWISQAIYSYIGVSLHFVNNEFKLEHYVLDIKQLSHPHTSQNITNILIKIVVEEFDIYDKIISITSDNGLNEQILFILQQRIQSQILENYSLNQERVPNIENNSQTYNNKFNKNLQNLLLMQLLVAKVHIL
ncbi:hypothetical protein ABPG72_002638 [Tetrahymena utriculariae]